MAELDGRLEKFYTTLNGKIEGMNAKISDLNSNVLKIININNTASGSISSAYKSAAVTTSLSGLSEINNSLSSINSSIQSVKSVLGECSSLLGKIEELKTLITSIGNLESSLLAATPKEGEEEKKANTNYTTILSELETSKTSFNKKQLEAIALYESIITKEAEVATSSVSVTDSGSALNGGVGITSNGVLGNLKWKTFDSGWKYAVASYKTSTGKTVDYVISVPPNFNPSAENGLVTYLHGTSNSGYSADKLIYRTSLLNEIKGKNNHYDANTVVLCPLSETGWSIHKEDREALKELTDTVMNTYNVSAKRNVISGGSMGGSGSIYMAASYPGYYAGCVSFSSEFIPRSDAFSSPEELGRALKDTVVYSYVGKNDKNSPTSYKNNVGFQNGSESAGGKFYLSATNGGHMDQIGIVRTNEFAKLIKQIMGLS